MTHEIINHEDRHKRTRSDFMVDDDGIQSYRGIQYELHKDRYMVVSNIDLLDLGLCTPKTIQRGHRGYSSLTTLMKRIDKGLGD